MFLFSISFSDDSCNMDDDCGAMEWCRCILDEETWEVVSFECVPYAQIGDYCGGYVMQCNEQVCAPGIDCIDMDPYIADEPGVCGILGCMDMDACNFDMDATVPDGSCEYYDSEVSCDCEGALIDINGNCCSEILMDECGVCFGDNSSCSDCDTPFIDIDGHCFHQVDIDVLQDFIDNSINSGHDLNCYDPNDPWCSSPNLYMDQGDNWHWVIINDDSYQFSNDNGIIEPLELGLQEWTDGRLTSLMCGAYIYCQLSGEIPNSISNLTDIEILRLEVNYFTGQVPESICELENVNFDDYLSFDLSYNELCPPYPDCIPENAVGYIDESECLLNGDFNQDNSVDIIDIVILVNHILSPATVVLEGADINYDGSVNILDVIALVSQIINY